MTKEDLLAFIKKEFKEIERLFKAKNGDYAPGNDALSNFKEAAITCGTTDYQAWFVYFFKHFIALQRWIRTGNMNTDTPKSRIQDMIVYLFLLMALLEENTNYGIFDTKVLNLWKGLAPVEAAYDTNEPAVRQGEVYRTDGTDTVNDDSRTEANIPVPNGGETND